MKTNSNKLFIPILILLEIILTFFLIISYSKKEPYNISFQDQELLLNIPGQEIQNGFYCDESMGKDALIQTPVFTLPKGIYQVSIDYTSKGPARSYRNNVLEVQSFYEGSGTLHYDIHVKDSENVTIQNRLGYEAVHDNYILIHNITLSTSDTDLRFFIFKTITFILLFNLILCYLWKRKELSTYMTSVSAEHRIVTLILLLTAFFISLPVMTGYVNQHFDTLFHMMRIEGIKDGLLSGQFPVRIQPTWLNEHGYATSIFYGELFLYIPALLRMAGIPMATVYSIYVISINISTLYACYYCFYKMSQNHYIGLAVSVFYTCSIYRLTALYVRNALGKSAAMIFYPLIVYGLWKIFSDSFDSKNSKKVWIPLVIGYTGIIQSHTISTFFAAIMTFIVCLIYIKKTLQIKRFIALTKAALFSIAVNVWFLIPFFDYMRYPWIGNTSNNDWGMRFITRAVYLPEYFMTDYKVMGNVLGIASGVNNEMPVSLGLSAILLIIISILVKTSLSKKYHRQETICYGMIIFILLLGSTLIPWDVICNLCPPVNSLLRSIQYPWRFLAIVVILLCWLFFITANKLIENTKLLYLFLIIMSSISFSEGLDFNSKVLNESNNMFISEMSGGYFYQIGGEYLPVGANLNDYQNTITLLDDTLEMSGWERNFNQITLSVTNTSSIATSYAEVPLLNYKGYKAVDTNTGQLFEIQDGNSSRIKLCIPASFSGDILISWHSPWYWRIAEASTLISILGLLYILFPKKTTLR